MPELRFLKELFKRHKKTVPPENPPRQTTDPGAGCGRDYEENNHGGGSRIANQSGRIGDQQLPAPNTSTQTPGHGGGDARRRHTHGGSKKARSDQLGRGTPDLHSAKRDPNRGERESRGSDIQRPSEAALERTFGGAQAGGDADDLIQSRVKKRDWVDRGLGRFGVAVGLAKGPAEAFGPLKAVLESISVLLVQYQNTVAVKDKIEILRSRITTLEKLLEKPASDKELRGSLLTKLEGIEEQLRSLHAKSALLRFVDNAQDSEDVSGLLEDLQEAVNDYMMVQQTAIYDQACKLMDAAEMAVLKNFRSAKGAEYRHGERKGCLKGTREAVLNGIELWARDGKSHVYWLNGLAGTGKSTIAKTIADRLFADGQLGASFFCSRDFEDRRNLHFIFPTLAVQLARKYTKFRSILVPLIQRDPEVAYESLYNQMEKLIAQPLNRSGISTVIVIDALDECEDEESASAILSVLGRLISEIPKVKFFLTGRPEQHIREGFRLPLLVKMADVFVLHEVEPCKVDSDVRLFFRHSFSELAGRRGLDDWPTEEQLEILCDRAAGLFVYAAATVKFIDNQNNNPRRRLDLLLQSPESSAREGKVKLKNTTLDSLYTSILQQAFSDDDPEDDPRVRSVLAAVVLAVNPLSPSTIAVFLGCETEDVFPLLSSVHSLLILQEDPNHPVRPFHKSFPDFVTDPTRCANQRFHISPPDHHSRLLIGCLGLMNRTLQKNMCGLPDGVANSDVSDLKERIERYIDPALQYACMSWYIHLVDAGAVPARVPTTLTLHQFLETKFLFWLEVLSVLGAVRNAVEALQVAVDWLEESPTLDLANDCVRFVTGYFEIISASSPHIYHSALVLAPQNSTVRKLYGSFAHPFTRIVHGVPVSWDTHIAATTRPSAIKLAVWSPCNRFIAIAWDDTMVVDVLDPVTLQRLQALEFPQDISARHEALIFSPDSRILTYCGNGALGSIGLDLFIISWDLQTGGITSIISWEKSVYFPAGGPSITYSANGKMVGVLYQSYYHTSDIVIFDVASGIHTHSHSLNDNVPPPNNIWTCGESLRFATADVTAITIWEVRFTSGATPTEVETFPAPDGFSDRWHREVWLLPAPCRLALASRDKVLVWDVQNSKYLLHHTGTSFHPRTLFSSDGRFFACSTTGSDVYLWKESPNGYILHQILASSTVHSNLLLSQNGESILAFGDCTIQLWRTDSFTTPPSSILARAPRCAENFVLEFSPNGTLVVVAMQGGNTVTVLELKSGVPQLTIDVSIAVHGLGMDGNTVVIIGDQKVIAWNLPAGDCSLDARAGLEASTRTLKFSNPRGSVVCATISSDLRHIVHISETLPSLHRLHIYNASTGKLLGWCKMAKGRTISRFSPDGCDIWCANRSGEAEVWRVRVVQRVLEDLEREVDIEDLKREVDIEDPPEGYPWGSSRGYRVTNDWWILGPDGKRLLMLPPPWRSYAVWRVWKGQFLALLHGGLSEVVILELSP